MNREEYEIMAKMMYKIPPKSETPEGQKFHIGEIVKIVKPKSWFSASSYNFNKDLLYEIEYSYAQKYGGYNTRQYSLKHLFENNSSSWYDEDELELVKGIEEIKEENDRSEYERLKLKYNGA